MSEYQYCEFLAIDRPLNREQLATVRALSSRASITANSFVNEYHWGNFRGDISVLMREFYDAHLYWANWGSRRLMLRLPLDALEPQLVDEYCIGFEVEANVAGDSLILDFTSEDESLEFEPDESFTLSGLTGIRTELLNGDLRGLYLAWLSSLSYRTSEDFHPHDLEPPVPPGLNDLTAAQQALAEFLRLDEDLLDLAREISPSTNKAHGKAERESWVQALPQEEKDRVILAFLKDPRPIRTTLLRRLRREALPNSPTSGKRKVHDLLDTAATRRADREQAEAQRREERRARRAEARAKAREEHLVALTEKQEDAWTHVEELIEQRKPEHYDAATSLLRDLRETAERQAEQPAFSERLEAIRQSHRRKVSLIDRLDKAELSH